MIFTCECCGYQTEFENAEEAWAASWDETCPLCPLGGVLGWFDHGPAHARWEVQGRPASFRESRELGDLPEPPAMPLEMYLSLRSMVGEDELNARLEDAGVRVEGT